MNIGILPDGSLSSRLKGDLYWKKQKLMLRSAQDLSEDNRATVHFRSKFHMADEKLGKGTFDSMDDLRDAHAIDASDNGTLSAEGRPVYNPDITEQRLHPSAIADYSDQIPENYVSQIKNASLTVKTYHDGDRFLGLTITGVHSNWVEIVWLSRGDDVSDDEVGQLLALIVDRAYAEKKYLGVFIELHVVPETAAMEKILNTVGMQTIHVKNNLYEFTYKDIVMFDKLLLATQKLPCTPISMLSEDTKIAMEDVVYGDKGPVPVALPIPWSSYRQDLSVANYDKKLADTGLLLVSEVGDTLVVDLLYGKNPVITAALIGNAVKNAEGIVSPDQKFLVPIVLEATRPLVEKLVPNATREDLVEAFIKF